MIRTEHMIIQGTDINESQLPILRDVLEHQEVEVNSLPESLADTIGHYCGYRVLPYKIQNHYDRNKKDKVIKTIVLENDVLKATFLPEYGGRLYSLYNKKLNRELLSVNPVFQPANLGLRNAWFSGGIEWNMAHFGHTFLSCDDVHFATVKEGDHEFLRMYEYERAKGLYYQIDFHLPEGSEHLLTFTKIFNITDVDTPLYYWSNIAVSELNKARVFSSTKEVIYIAPYFNDKGEMINTFSYGELPNLTGIDGDVSYPRNFSRSNEYFFQTDKKTEYPWEAVGYDDGFLFYECSTQPLAYRKMFCWGTHKGGTKWQEYLSEVDGDKYVEIQAGIFPSQLHSEKLAAKTNVSFMQIFGGGYVEDKNEMYKDFDQSNDYVSEKVFDILTEDRLKTYEADMIKMSDHAVLEVLHNGHPYGGYEVLRMTLEHGEFPIKSMTFSENDGLLKDILMGRHIDVDLRTDEIPFITDKKWLKYLKNYDTEYTHLMIGLIYSEHLALDEAISYMKHHVKESDSSLTFRTLGAMYWKSGQNELALKHYKIAYDKLNEMKIKYYEEDFLTEYLELLNENSLYEVVWHIYNQHKHLDQEEFLLQVGVAAYELKHSLFLKNLFKKEPERIREGNTTLVELWYKVKAEEMNISLEEAKEGYQAPDNIDFRML